MTERLRRVMTSRGMLVAMWALSLALIAVSIPRWGSGIPLWAPPVGTTRWVFGMGSLRVEHTFDSHHAARGWPRVDVWTVSSGIWTSDLQRPASPRAVGYANVVMIRPAVMLLTATMLATWIALGNRWNAKPHEPHCAACGYDLRATPDRCPECGGIVVVRPPNEHAARPQGIERRRGTERASRDR